MKTLSTSIVRSSMAAFRVEKSLRKGGDECRLASINFSIPSTNGTVNGDTTAETFSYRTPMYMIHTQSGTVPHVTPEVLNLIYPTASGNAVDASCVPPIQISVDSTVKFVEPLQKFGKGIGKFVGLPDVPTFLTVHDSLQMLKPGHNDKFGIAMWSRHGRAVLTPERFVQALGCFKPSLCQILSDYDVSAESSGMKRLKKSLARAEEYTSFVAEEKEKLKLARSPGLFITVEAAWFEMDEELAKKTMANLLESQHQVEGVVIAGLVDRFAKPGPIVNDKEGRRVGEASKVRTPQDLKLDIVDSIVKTIPPSLPRYVPGPFSLSQMVSLISKGIDMLDSSVVSKMADHGELFILDEVEAIMTSLSLSAVLRRTTDNETIPQRGEESKDNDQCSTIKENFVISIKEKRFFDDFRPLSNSCMCYTCRKHTRSYVHHLYATDELLGPVLVQIHNLTALDRLFQIIRGIIRDSDSPESLSEKFTKLQQLLENPLTEAENLENPKMLKESSTVTQ